MDTNKILRKVLEKTTYCPNVGCWIWLGGLTGHGYGSVFLKKVEGKSKHAILHRWYYKNFVNKDIGGLDLHHICANKMCWNPNHLFPLTRSAHMKLESSLLYKPHCIHGHLLIGYNLIVRKNGYRDCRTCKKQSRRIRYYERMKVDPIFRENNRLVTNKNREKYRKNPQYIEKMREYEKIRQSHEAVKSF